MMHALSPMGRAHSQHDDDGGVGPQAGSVSDVRESEAWHPHVVQAVTHLTTPTAGPPEVLGGASHVAASCWYRPAPAWRFPEGSWEFAAASSHVDAIYQVPATTGSQQQHRRREGHESATAAGVGGVAGGAVPADVRGVGGPVIVIG